MAARLKETFRLLRQDIYPEETFGDFARILRRVSLAFSLVMLFFVFYNNRPEYRTAQIMCALLAVGFFIISRLVTDRKYRLTCNLLMTVLSGGVLAFYTFAGTNGGFGILWSLLLPLVVMYSAGVLFGLAECLFLEACYIAAFYTPVRELFMVGKYTDIFMTRFPILYGTYTVVAGLLMIQYHLTSLKQIENKKQLEYEVEKQKQIAVEMEALRGEAEKANQAKSTFLAQMSHEIRTPINAILGMNEMVLRECEDEDLLAYANNIQSAGRTLLSLINSILDFSKIEDGKMEIVPVEYDTASMLNDLVQAVADRAERKGLLLEVEIDPELPRTLYGDDVRIRQVVTNLLTNAVKYTPAGTVTLNIGCERDPEGRNAVLRVAVRDTGIGIRPEDMDKLFASFQRLDLERNRSIEGTGLGISIVQQLLKLMGSTLEVESVYGEGSVFSFSLAQGITDGAPIGDYKARLEESLRSRKEETWLYAPEARVLVVDDYPLNLKVAAGLMKRCGIVPDLADSGRACIEKVREKTYDVIFLDHMMPEMDGIETLRAIRAEDGLLPPGTRLVMMTANAISGMREIYLKEGFDEYLSKPVDSAQLERLLHKTLPAGKVSFRTGGPKRPAHAEPPAEAGPSASAPEASEIAEPDGAETADAFTEAEIRALEAAVPGLQVEAGLPYCMGSKAFYLEILGDYAKEDKEEQLAAFLAAGDLPGYATVVHALKNISRTIGCGSLAEKDEALQFAAEREDAAFVREHHGEAVRQYTELKAAIRAYLG